MAPGVRSEPFLLPSFGELPFSQQQQTWKGKAGNTKGGSITVPWTSFLTGLD